MEPDSVVPYPHNGMLGQYASASTPTPFRLDEGFSEDLSGQDDNGHLAFERLQEWIMAQGENTRMDIAYEILRTLRTSNVAAVVERLTPLLHMDPMEKLPPEITAEIFTYLDASTLLTASLASTTWRGRILDSRLWQKLFAGQGWGVETRELKHFEDSMSLVRSSFSSRQGKGRSHDTESGLPQLKKRATADWKDSRARQVSADVGSWREQHGPVEADSDQEMRDVSLSSQNSPQRSNKRHSQPSDDEMDYHPAQSSIMAQVGTQERRSSTGPSTFRPKLTTKDTINGERINWAYLYKQRRRLEENWTKGRYRNFQLPDPAYPQEAHTECVYCIQFSGKWLVSGSRDKTLRVWDLETRRLRGRPLTGHSQSVLCLQFDPNEEDDVIISGSSDSSVIVWRFSTGQKLHEIPTAHEESVLNLRFDRRYLVTCSKDKKIKVWNRQQLLPISNDYPRIPASTESARVPSYIVDMVNLEPSLVEARLANGSVKPLRPYTHLVTFVGHSAAVNAIQIHGDLIVSASGDRLIKVWNVKTGKLLRSLSGHQKGIACVQFDSKRIVSGSSDNTVRIFDPFTGSEVAELKGHSNLVRTVQAGFGDLPGSQEEDLLKARAAERKHNEDVDAGRIADDRSYDRRLRGGELGTSRVSFGSRLPPGGGGSRWGKIVSGSYDESIIIWRKNSEGDWVVGQTLRQDNAIRVARGEQPQPTHAPPPPPAQIATGAPPAPASAPPAPPSAAAAGPHPGQTIANNAAQQIMQQAVNQSFATLGAGLSNVVGIARNLNTPRVPVPARSSSGQGGPGPATISSSSVSNAPFGQIHTQVNGTLSSNMNAVFNNWQAQQGQVSNPAAQNRGMGQTLGQSIDSTMGTGTTHQQAINAQGPGTLLGAPPVASPQPMQAQGSNPIPEAAVTAHENYHSQVTSLPDPNAGPSTASQPQLQAPQPQHPPHTITHPHPPGHHHHHHHHHHHAPNGAVIVPHNNANANVSRVFKLQFDARRIVCCSQDSRIIGWDFANGDKEVEECGRFFTGP